MDGFGFGHNRAFHGYTPGILQDVCSSHYDGVLAWLVFKESCISRYLLCIVLAVAGLSRKESKVMNWKRVSVFAQQFGMVHSKRRLTDI